VPVSDQKGKVASAISATAPVAMKTRLVLVPRSTRNVGTESGACDGPPISVPGPREQAVGPDREHDQEGDMPGQDLEIGLDRRADRLGDAENDRADQGAPHIA